MMAYQEMFKAFENSRQLSENSSPTKPKPQMSLHDSEGEPHDLRDDWSDEEEEEEFERDSPEKKVITSLDVEKVEDEDDDDLDDDEDEDDDLINDRIEEELNDEESHDIPERPGVIDEEIEEASELKEESRQEPLEEGNGEDMDLSDEEIRNDEDDFESSYGEQEKERKEETKQQSNLQSEKSDLTLEPSVDEKAERQIEAEALFSKLSQEMHQRAITIRTLFGEVIHESNHNGKKMETMQPEDFFTKLLTINLLLDRDEKNAITEILSKGNDLGLIQVSELIIILANYGVQELPTPKASQSRKKKKPMNFSSLSNEALRILCLFTEHLLNSDTSVYEFFDGTIYNQIVKTKNKQTTVEIISSEDFFKRIKECEELSDIGVLINESTITELTPLLALDTNYQALLLIKKVIKSLEELSHNEALRV